MKKILIVLITLLCITLPLFAGGNKEKDNTVYTVAASCDYPPLEYIDSDGNISGYEMDLIREIAEEENININIVNVSFDGIVAGLQSGQYDIGASGLTITEERKKVVDFTSPILRFNLAIVTKSEVNGAKNEDDLKGKRVGAQLGSTCQFACEDAGLNVSTYDEVPSAVLDLINGNLDAVVMDNVVANDYVFRNKGYSGKLKVSGSFENVDDMALAVKKGNERLYKKLQDGLERLDKNGKLEKLKSKHGLL